MGISHAVERLGSGLDGLLSSLLYSKARPLVILIIAVAATIAFVTVILSAVLHFDPDLQPSTLNLLSYSPPSTA